MAVFCTGAVVPDRKFTITLKRASAYGGSTAIATVTVDGVEYRSKTDTATDTVLRLPQGTEITLYVLTSSAPDQNGYISLNGVNVATASASKSATYVYTVSCSATIKFGVNWTSGDDTSGSGYIEVTEV